MSKLISDLELYAKEVCELAARLDFYAAWVPMIHPDEWKMTHRTRYVQSLVEEFDDAISALAAEVADRFSP